MISKRELMKRNPEAFEALYAEALDRYYQGSPQEPVGPNEIGEALMGREFFHEYEKALFEQGIIV